MENERLDYLIEERNNILDQHQSNRDQWLEESNTQLDYQLDDDFEVRENEYEIRTEKYNEWVF